MASASAGLRGPRLDPPEAAALYGIGAVADGRLQKYWGDVKDCPISSEPTTLSPCLISEPAASCGNTAAATPLVRKG
ncbi:hypothetical protein G6F65_022439 [Rhizopus arrhizus]|nr:hypothetical protein G6F65_022439 [Rhizopus arrhizus]